MAASDRDEISSLYDELDRCIADLYYLTDDEYNTILQSFSSHNSFLAK